MSLFSIKNHTTGKIIRLSGDVRSCHPQWVHDQMGTETESDLQHALDQYCYDDFVDTPGTPDCNGVLMTAEDAAEWREESDPFTHIFCENGNGFPSEGEEVLIVGECGWHQLKKVARTSHIHTRQWEANYIYLTLTDADRDYSDLTDEEQDEAWESLPHVEEIAE